MPTQKDRFPSKIALHLKKVCYKVHLCKYVKVRPKLTKGVGVAQNALSMF